MATWRALAAILTMGGMVAGIPARAEMLLHVSLGSIGAGIQEQHPLALRCLGLAPGADLLRGLSRQGGESLAADDADEMPARVYGFALAGDDDEEPACAMRQAEALPEA